MLSAGPSVLGAGVLLGMALLSSSAHAQSYDLRFDWSNTQNPGANWTYREGVRPLPPIANWDPLPSTNWSVPQQGWAVAPSAPGGAPGGGGTPFWFRSNGSETFEHDWLAGDIIVRTRDAADGSGNGAGSHGSDGPGTGNGQANMVWTSPLDGFVTLVSTYWKGQPAQTNHYVGLSRNGTFIALFGVSPANNYTRAAPFTFQVSDFAVLRGDPIEFRVENNNTTSTSRGAFFGVNLNIIVCIGVTRQPSHALVCPGASTSVSVQARTSYGSLTYRWRKDGVPLLEGGGGGHYHGVFGPVLSITGMTAAEAGSYDCVVGSVCSVLPSDAATVTLCRADFDCSGVLSVQDIFAYLSAWFAADPRAEFDQSPGLAMGDIVEFVNAWFAGCE